MTQIMAKIIEDSVSPDGHRLTTFQCTYPRFIHSEVMTHCVLDRNSASSRAIPVEKQLAKLADDPVTPVRWPVEQPGMQGGADLEGDDLLGAQKVWELGRLGIHELVSSYVEAFPKEHRLHKSVVNRMMECWQWHTAAITGTAFVNFFGLRDHPDAQPEFQVLARAMRELYNASTPNELDEGEWHLPYVDDETYVAISQDPQYGINLESVLPMVSAARVARTSYETQEGIRDFKEDVRLFERLSTSRPMHASPMGQVARVDEWNQHHVEVPLPDGGMFLARLPKIGKFIGYRQFRHDLEMVAGYQSFS